MENQFKRRLAKERRKWGAVVLLNVALLLVFPQRNSILDVLSLQNIIKAVEPSKKIISPIFLGNIPKNSGQ